MAHHKTIRYIDQMCVKDGDIQVKNISPNGTYTLIVPVTNGGEEFNAERIVTLYMEFSYDEEDVILYHSPKSLLTSEDYIRITETIEAALLFEVEKEPEDDLTPNHSAAGTLLTGWMWEEWDDGSGDLKSPDGKRYFSYDRAPYANSGGIEFKTTEQDH